MSEIIENLLIDLSNQQYLDIFLYIFMIFFLYLGWKKGAVFQIFYLFSLLIAVPLGVGTAIFLTENIIPKKIMKLQK